MATLAHEDHDDVLIFIADGAQNGNLALLLADDNVQDIINTEGRDDENGPRNRIAYHILQLKDAQEAGACLLPALRLDLSGAHEVGRLFARGVDVGNAYADITHLTRRIVKALHSGEVGKGLRVVLRLIAGGEDTYDLERLGSATIADKNVFREPAAEIGAQPLADDDLITTFAEIGERTLCHITRDVRNLCMLRGNNAHEFTRFAHIAALVNRACGELRRNGCDVFIRTQQLLPTRRARDLLVPFSSRGGDPPDKIFARAVKNTVESRRTNHVGLCGDFHMRVGVDQLVEQVFTLAEHHARDDDVAHRAEGDAEQCEHRLPRSGEELPECDENHFAVVSLKTTTSPSLSSADCNSSAPPAAFAVCTLRRRVLPPCFTVISPASTAAAGTKNDFLPLPTSMATSAVIPGRISGGMLLSVSNARNWFS
jgi:hypothetical protein